MNLFLDCEFDGFGGRLLSLALAPQNRLAHSLYLVSETAEEAECEWVRENVVPILHDHPTDRLSKFIIPQREFGKAINSYLADYSRPHIVVDWPDDLRYFCESLITGPGQMVPLRTFTSQLVREDAYPTTLVGAVQHNALWDALALREILTNG